MDNKPLTKADSSATRVWYLQDIKRALRDVDVLTAMADAFISYSAGKAVVPPVGELLFEEPPGDAHIKYGYVRGDRWFVIKVATGFYRNPQRGLPSNSGLMLVFDAATGIPHAVLLDQGYLTNIRTAAAGAFAAKLLAPDKVSCIGIVGSGVQARLQLQMLTHITCCRKVRIYARDSEKARRYAREISAQGYAVRVEKSPAAVAAAANLIVTTTAACEPLLFADDIKPGTHITAVGSDTPPKNEIDPGVLNKAAIVAVDSLPQSAARGEVFHAVGAGAIAAGSIVELGTLALQAQKARLSDRQITIADLTGVATQDIEICKAVLARLAPDTAREPSNGY